MIENEMEGKDENVGEDLAARRVRFENERMTRRGALRKFGFMAGMAVFATLSVDDLARIAAKKMQDAEATKGIGDTLAKEFRAAGVALANDDAGGPLGGYYMAANPWGAGCATKPDCSQCCTDKYTECRKKEKWPGECRSKETACSTTCSPYSSYQLPTA